jgi:hypothetical protein
MPFKSGLPSGVRAMAGAVGAPLAGGAGAGGPHAASPVSAASASAMLFIGNLG